MVRCPTCGAPNPQLSAACFNCQGFIPPPKAVGGLAVASLICAIAGFCIPLVSLAAVIMGWVELGNIKKGASSPEGRGMASAGLGLGLVPFACFGAYVLLALIVHICRGVGR
jgi:hypothetical protein